MKQSLLFAGLAAATLCLVGCNKEADVKGLDGRKVEIVLSDAVTRTVNADMHTTWAANDELNVFCAPAGTTTYGDNHKFTITDAANNKATGTVELTADAYDWYLLYPYDSHIKTPANTGKGYLPVGCQSNKTQTQDGLDSKEHLAGPNLPVWGVAKNVARGTVPDVTMKHVTSVIAVNVTNSTEAPLAVSSVSFTAPEDIVGTYYINFAGETPAFEGSGDNYVSKTATLTVTGDASIAAGASAMFYLAIKPFTAHEGDDLKLKVSAGDDFIEKTITLPSDVEFEPGKIKTLNISYAGGTQLQSSSLAEIAAMDAGTEVLTDAVLVVAKNARGIMLAQTGTAGTTYMMAFDNSGVTGAVGDIVTVSGVVAEYGNTNLKQINSPKVTVVTSNNEVVLPDPNVLTTLDDYASTSVEMIQYTGTLTISGNYYNVVVSGSNWKGSIQFPLEADVTALTNLNEKIVKATGFFTGVSGSSTKYVNMMMTSVEEVTDNVFEVTPTEIAVKATDTSAQINVTGNVAWTVDAGDNATADPASGTGAGTVTVSFDANTEAEAQEYHVFIRTDASGVQDEFEVVITQAAFVPETYPYEEEFDDDEYDFTIDDVKLTGGLTFVWKYNSNKYMKATAYKSGNLESESWLISPVVDMTGAEHPALTFDHAILYFTSVDKAKEEATVWVRIKDGDWTKLEGVTYPTALDGSFVNSGSIDLSDYIGQLIQIGFKYTSTTTKAGTWEVKNFKLDEFVSEFGATVSTTSVPSDASTVNVNVTGNVAWTASVTGGAELSASSGTGASALTVSIPANTTQEQKTYVVTVQTTAEVETKSFEFTITQDALDITNQSFTWDLTTNSYESASADEVFWSHDAATMKVEKDESTTNANNYLGGSGNYSSTRFYNKQKLTVTPAGGVTIQKVEFTAMTANYATAFKGSTWTNATAAVDGTLVTVTPTVGTTAFYATIGGTCGFSAVKVYYSGVPEAPALESITLSGQTTSYNVGDTFSFDGEVTAHYNNNSTKKVTPTSVSSPDMTTAGKKTVTVSYSEGEVTKQAEYEITVSAPATTYTLDPATGSNSSYAENCDIAIDGITWNLTGNSQLIPWRIGGKSITNVDRTLYSKTAMGLNVGKIVITHGAASNITVNSMTVIVATDKDFSNKVSTLTPTFVANSTVTINRPANVESWNNCYYKIVYNVSVSGNSNKFLEFSKAVFSQE